MRRQRRSFTRSLNENQPVWFWNKAYTINEARLAVGVGETVLRRWVDQLKYEYQGVTAIGSKALTSEQQRIQELEAQVKRIEREKEILKKATALLMSDSMRSLI